MSFLKSHNMLPRLSQRLRAATALSAGLLTAGLLAQPVFATESRSYVVGWFSNAASSRDGDCRGGANPDIGEQFRRNLAQLGKSEAEIDELMQHWLNNGERANELVDLMTYRGRIDGEPVNAYAHPAAVADPNLKAVEGKYAYGFDLDGKESPESFEDPVTGETGIDHQLFRALGCIEQYRGTRNNDPTYWTWAWTMMKGSMPGWLITISGEDLDQDGEVTVRFDRALEHVAFNTGGEARSHATYRVDPDPRSQHVFAGKIEDGVVSITEPGPMRLLKDPLSFPELKLSQTHLRLNIQDDESLEGLIGGYQPWEPIYFAFGQTSFGGETMVTGDLPGMFHLLRKHADADPDPETGQNRAISVAYRLKAVPAFIVSPSTEFAVD